MTSILSDISRKKLGIFILFSLISGFLYLLYLPADYFDEGQSICISVLLADTKCYACGMTRAIQHMIHADFSTAWEYNKISFIVVPLAIYMTASSLYKMIYGEKNAEKG